MGYLTLLWLIPALGAVLVWLSPSPRAARWAAFAVALSALAYSIWLLRPYGSDLGALRLEEWGRSSAIGIRYHLGTDGLSLPLCWLTALLLSLSMLCAWGKELPASYWASFLALEACLFGVFTSQNLFYFFVFWDVSLVPMFFIIGLWGSQRRKAAAVKFMLYTFLGSLSLLVGIIGLATAHHAATGIWTWDLPALRHAPIPAEAARWIFAAIALGLAVKIPLFPLHPWLPEAHTEAPTAASVLLAGSMLKMGIYGFLRILLPVFPRESAAFWPFLAALGAVNVVYGALCAVSQKDLKRLVAYTSVSHMGFCMLGLFSLTIEGLAGASLQMLNHGLSTGGLFLLVGALYDRTHHRGVDDFGGLARGAPWLAFFFGLILLSSIGLPGLNGFVGEAMALAGMAKASVALAALGLAGTVLAAAYGLPAYQKVFWAPAGERSVSGSVLDLDLRERGAFWVLTALILAIGLYPGPLLRFMEPALLPLVRP